MTNRFKKFAEEIEITKEKKPVVKSNENGDNSINKPANTNSAPEKNKNKKEQSANVSASEIPEKSLADFISNALDSTTHEVKKNYTFTMKKSTRKKLAEITKGLHKKSDSAMLEEMIDFFYQYVDKK